MYIYSKNESKENSSQSTVIMFYLYMLDIGQML